MDRASSAGFSIIEALVALLIFSLAASALATTLATAQRTRYSSALRLQASQLAEAEMERARRRQSRAGTVTIGKLTCTTTAEVQPDYTNLERVTVIVDWVDRVPQHLELSTYMSGAEEP